MTSPSVAAVTVTVCRWLHDAPFAYSMTYDEGTIDVMANALPIHEQFGFPGHLDVVAGQLGRPRDCWLSSLNGHMHMSATELREMVARGWGVGNHSWSHFVYPLQPGLNLYREVVWSKYRLEDDIQCPVRIFTIPNDVYNYDPVINLVRQHYLACAYIEGGPNRDGFDLYRIGNNLVASGGNRPRAGWPRELDGNQRMTLDYLHGSWLYETTHLCLPNVKQDWKNVTPDFLTERFEKLTAISNGRLWAARPDDVIDYELMRRNLTIENVRADGEGITFDVGGQWPVGVCNPRLTLRIAGLSAGPTPVVRQEHRDGPAFRTVHDRVLDVRADGPDWIVTLELAPHRVVHVAST